MNIYERKAALERETKKFQEKTLKAHQEGLAKHGIDWIETTSTVTYGIGWRNGFLWGLATGLILAICAWIIFP